MLPIRLAKVPTFHRIAVGRNFELQWHNEGVCVVTAGTFLDHVYQAVGCPGRHSWRPGLGWCRRSIDERRSWRFLWVLQQRKVVGCYPGVQNLTVRRCCAVAPVDMLAVEVANIQDWECRNGRWCESRRWRFADPNDLISCAVYAWPLSRWFLWSLIDTCPFQQLVNKRGKAVIPTQDWSS